MIRQTALLISLLLALPVPALADARADYRKGLDALAEHDLPAAIDYLTAAIEQKPEARAGRIRRYLPHYQLGKAFFLSGDCESALAAWDESIRQGAVVGQRESKEIDDGRRVCARRENRQTPKPRSRPAPREDGRAGIRREVESAESIALLFTRLRYREDLADFWDAGDPSRGEQLNAAARLLDQARAVAADRSRSVPRSKLREAESWAVTARTRMQVLYDQAQVTAQEAEMPIDAAHQILESIQTLQPWSDEMAEAAALVESLLAIAETRDRDPASVASTEIDSRLAEFPAAVARLRTTAAYPPETLIGATHALIRGDYAGVVSMLEEVAIETDRAVAHAHLLLAASRFALYVFSEQTDGVLLEQAQADARACRQAEPSLAPSRDLFSPRFVEFFDRAVEP